MSVTGHPMTPPPNIPRICHRRRAGFTLIEVVLALGLCSFALVSLVSLLPISLNTARNSVEITRKAKLTQQVIAELAQSRFQSLIALSGTVVQRTFDYDGLPTTESNSIYFTVRTTVEASTTLPGSSTASPSLARVKIEVKTPRETMPGKTAVVLSDSGY